MMSKIYFFDWGNTLMVDFDKPGAMCDWDEVAACDGAEELLAYIAKNHKIYIATGAGQSSPEQVKKAFERVHLDRYIDGYFCESNVGVPKGTPDFLKLIVEHLHVNPEDVVMVGDRLEKDIKPALALGMNAVWITDEVIEHTPPNLRIIESLKEISLF